MSTDLTRIGQKARQAPETVFTSLYHHVTDVDHLRACYEALDGRKAVGVDGVTKAQYGADLEANLQALSARLKRMAYRPQPKRRTYVPKPGSAQGRPLGISCFEDKLVELAVKRVLEPIYEAEFEPNSYGYRPECSPHGCLDALGRTLQQHPVNHVVEADIRSFFDLLNHQWLLKFLRHRIGDPRILRLIQRMLKAGVMEDGLTWASDYGTPQGSILSPLLSNIYLHYVLDLWFNRRVGKQCQGEAYYFRFADDFVACFQYQRDAEAFLAQLDQRLRDFDLRLASEKTRCLAFGRYARPNAHRRGGKPSEFTFLGFTHYCGQTRNGAFKVKRRTSRKKFQASLRGFTEWVRTHRHQLRTSELFRRAQAKVAGHLNYFAVTDNFPLCQRYVYWAERILRYWLNRRSQRRSYTWPAFRRVLACVGWPRVSIRQDLNPFRRLATV